MVISRREFTARIGFGGCLLAAGPIAFGQDASSGPVATTQWGRIRGRTIDGVHVFKGVRYGASTAGKHRFLAPRTPTPWRGIAEAHWEGPQCFQMDPLGKPPPDGFELPESEDCLRLNVWTPGLRDGRKRPVMVWLHGGGLWRGSVAGDYADWPIAQTRRREGERDSAIGANEGPWQEGRNLGRLHDVVVVSPNHRIGVMGFAFLEAFDQELEGSGNAGTLDMVLALQWIRDNIEEFGGDPANVTIFGLSGGGQKVSLLLATPAAEGLFHKAILMSGPMPLTIGPHYATEIAGRLLGRLGLNEHSARKIQDLPPRAIMQAYFEAFHAMGGYGVWGLVSGVAPVVDGRILPRQLFWNGAPECSRHVPLIIGTTRTEMTDFVLSADPQAYRMDWPTAASRLGQLLNQDAAQILAQFRDHHPRASAWEVYSLILAHWPTRSFSIKIAEEKTRQKAAPVYMYRTEWQTPVRNGMLMSPHAIDSAFAFDTADTDTNSNGGGPEPQAMARQMSASWVAFAHSGSPQTSELPPWPAYDEHQRATMTFNLPSQTVLDPDAADRKSMQPYLDRYQPDTVR